MRGESVRLTNPRAWVAITVGVALVGVVWFAVQGDGNAPGTWVPSEVVEVQVCADTDATPEDVLEEAAVFAALGWPDARVTRVPESECGSPAPDGVQRLHRWGDWRITDGPTEETEADGGWTIPRIEGGRLVASDTWLRSRTERQRLTLRHELGHGLHGLALPGVDGSDGHDQHGSRLMASVPGESMVGLDRREGGDFEWRAR